MAVEVANVQSSECAGAHSCVPEDVEDGVSERRVFVFLAVVEDSVGFFGHQERVVDVFAELHRGKPYFPSDAGGHGVGVFAELDELAKGAQVVLERHFRDGALLPGFELLEFPPGDAVHVVDAGFVGPLDELFQPVSVVCDGGCCEFVFDVVDVVFDGFSWCGWFEHGCCCNRPHELRCAVRHRWPKAEGWTSGRFERTPVPLCGAVRKVVRREAPNLPSKAKRPRVQIPTSPL